MNIFDRYQLSTVLFLKFDDYSSFAKLFYERAGENEDGSASGIRIAFL